MPTKVTKQKGNTSRGKIARVDKKGKISKKQVKAEKIEEAEISEQEGNGEEFNAVGIEPKSEADQEDEIMEQEESE